MVYATVLAVALSFLDRAHRLTPRPAGRPRSSPASAGCSPVAAVCAAAGIITATTTKTGLGPQSAALLVGGAQAVTDEPDRGAGAHRGVRRGRAGLLGLAVPVTASFVIGWVIIGPALLDLGVTAPAAAMFVFYFAVLSEVAPPTALAAVAAAAVTGGRLVPTMWQTLRYALPAFLAPIAFVLTAGRARACSASAASRRIACRRRWSPRSASRCSPSPPAAGCPASARPAPPERLLGALAGAALLWLEPVPVAVGAALAAVAAAGVLVRRGSAGRPIGRGSPAEPEEEQQ